MRTFDSLAREQETSAAITNRRFVYLANVSWKLKPCSDRERKRNFSNLDLGSLGYIQRNGDIVFMPLLNYLLLLLLIKLALQVRYVDSAQQEQ